MLVAQKEMKKKFQQRRETRAKKKRKVSTRLHVERKKFLFFQKEAGEKVLKKKGKMKFAKKEGKTGKKRR